MIRIILMGAVCIGWGLTYAQMKMPGSKQYKISLTTNNNEYSLGEPVWVTVEYYNGSDSVWRLYRPDSSFYNSLSYRNFLWRTEEIWSGYAFNKSIFINDNPDCPECGFAVPLTGGVIQIKPKDKYSFKTDLMEGQKEHAWVLPGKYLIRYYDGYEAIRSDTIAKFVEFTQNSISYLLKVLADEKESKSNIEWAIMLLSDIYPEMKKYQYSCMDNTVIYNVKQKENNNKLLADYNFYCEQNKNKRIVEDKIRKINIDFRKYYFMDMRRMND